MLLPLKIPGENPFWLMVVAGSPWPSLACSGISPISASIFTWHSSLCVCISVSSCGLLIKILAIGFRAHPNLVNRILTEITNYICKDPVSKLGHTMRFQMNTNLGEERGQHHSISYMEKPYLGASPWQ